MITSATMYLTRQQVAAAFQISERTVVDLVARGVLPQPVRLTRKTVRWLRTEVEALGSVGSAA
jgi:predicted DNA-binding transcriptional regulator AlpA